MTFCDNLCELTNFCGFLYRCDAVGFIKRISCGILFFWNEMISSCLNTRTQENVLLLMLMNNPLHEKKRILVVGNITCPH